MTGDREIEQRIRESIKTLLKTAEGLAECIPLREVHILDRTFYLQTRSSHLNHYILPWHEVKGAIQEYGELEVMKAFDEKGFEIWKMSDLAAYGLKENGLLETEDYRRKLS